MQWIKYADHILIYQKYKEYIFDWANKYGIENLAPYVKTYYVLSRLNDDLCGVGIKPFLRNGTLGDRHHLKDYLIDSCKEINNTTLTQLCNQVLDLEQQYNISQNELLPFPCEEQLQNLNTKFVQFNNKYSLNDMIEEYFGKKYHKDCMGMFGIVQAGYTRQFLASKDKDADYDIFVGWYSDSCREYDTAMRNNPTLYGAYIAMSYHNEVCNGGFDQFWDYAENSKWDLEQIKTLFQQVLPADMYKLYVTALTTHNNGQDCEELNQQYDYDKMQDEVLPQLAAKVGDYYRQRATTHNK